MMTPDSVLTNIPKFTIGIPVLTEIYIEHRESKKCALELGMGVASPCGDNSLKTFPLLSSDVVAKKKANPQNAIVHLSAAKLRTFRNQKRTL
jgi:hypothetical protein